MKSRTVIACLTPPGRGAIATLGLHGPRAWQILRSLFCLPSAQGDKKLPESPVPGKTWIGRLGGAERGESDQVVLACLDGGEFCRLELHCHGGIEIIRMFCEIFASEGVEVVPWQECDAETDPLRAAARLALSRAPTVRCAAILLDQYHGALARALADIRSALQVSEVATACRLIDELADRAALGRHLVEPWRVVIAGAPNVGKSSLVNALAGFERSIVSPIPGTTRDVVATCLAIDGWPVELIDTAGARDSADALEAEGVRRARIAAEKADLCLWIVDASTRPILPRGLPARTCLVTNKIDLPAAWDLNDIPDALRVSARTGAGLADLCHFLSHKLVPCPPPGGAAVPFTRAWCGRLEEAREMCRQGKMAEVIELCRCDAEP